MARTVLTPFEPDPDGVVAPTEQDGDPTNGHIVANTGRTIIVARNNGASPFDVTFVTPGTVDGLPVEDRVVSVAAGETRHFGRFRPSAYSGGLAIDVADVELKLLAIEP